MTAISELLPHQGNMVLIDKIVACDENNIICTTLSHRLSDNPLRNSQGLPISASLEIGAQAIALHGISNRPADAPPKSASIISVKKATWSEQWLQDLDLLTIKAALKTKLDTIAKYSFTIETQASSTPIYEAEVSVSLS